jgi:hypothetical protein
MVHTPHTHIQSAAQALTNSVCPSRRHFFDDTETVPVEGDHVLVDLAPRTYTPTFIDGGFPELDLEVPW